MLIIYNFDEIKSKRDRFIDQTRFYAPYLKKYKMIVNFKGYTEIWNNYFSVDNADMNTLFNLIKELIMWKNYFSNLHCMFKMRHTSALNKKLYLESFKNKYRKNKILEEQLNDVEDEIKFFNEYSKLLYKQEKNFNSAIKHCQQLYDEGISSYIKSI